MSPKWKGIIRTSRAKTPLDQAIHRNIPDEYIATYNNYNRGNYNYRTLINKQLAKQKIEERKMIAFKHKSEFDNLFLCAMIFFLCLGLFLQFGVKSFHPMEIINPIVFGVLITLCYALRVWIRKYKEVYIFGTDGICFWWLREPYFLSWKHVIDIDVEEKLFVIRDFDEFQRIRIPYKDIQLNGQNGLLLEISPFNLDFKEFPRKMPFQKQINLFIFIITEYWKNYNKQEEIS